MKSLVQHIYERRHVNNSVILLSNHIYDKLKELVNKPANNPKFNNETLLYELYKEYYEEYDIEIWFNDIQGFDWWETQLLTFGLLDNPEYDCDMVVRLENMGKDEFGCMDRSEPILSINANHFKTQNSFKKNSGAIRNTLIHELTHYLQYMGNVMKGGTHQKKESVKYDKIFYDEANKLNNQKYATMSFMIYSFIANERHARVSGMYGIMQEEFESLMKDFNKKHKNGTKEEFVDFVIGQNKYNDNVLHIQHYGDFLKFLEDDTYADYKKCIDDPNTIYRDDSSIYIFLNFCDHCNPKPSYLLPKKSTCIFNTQTEEEYNIVKNSIISMFKKNFDKYVKNIKEVVGDYYDEMMMK